jgi:hypothetical protein
MHETVTSWAWSDQAFFAAAGAVPVQILEAVGRAIVTAGAGLAAPASATMTLIALTVMSRRRSSNGAIPFGR